MHKNRLCTFLCCILVIVALFLGDIERVVNAGFSSSPTIQEEQNTSSACYSLDVVFLIDQSESMSGNSATPPNDPTSQRVYAPQWAIDWLVDNALDICPDSIHRIAVISYGDKAYQDLELSIIDPDNQEEANRIRERLKANIQPRNYGQTNPKSAFDMAVKILDDAAPMGNAPRKRVIIFITDGHPCVASLGCTPPSSTMDFVGYATEMKEQVMEALDFDTVLLKQEACLSEARLTYGADSIPSEVSTQCLADYRTDAKSYNNSTYIWTLLLKHSSAYSSRLRDQYVEFSETHSGEVINLTENRSDIPATFLNILTQLAGVKAQRLSCGNFAVNPYLRQMRLVFFKVDMDTNITLSYVDNAGVTHRIENGQGDSGFNIVEHDPESINERYVLDNPYPGIWHFDSDDCSGISAYYEPLEMSVGGLQKPLQLANVNGEAYYLDATLGDTPQILVSKTVDPDDTKSEDKYYLQYTIRDESGSIIPQADSPLFAIDFGVSVLDPRGNNEDYAMEWIAEKQLFQSKDFLKLPYQGEYQVAIKADTVNRNFPYGPIETEQLGENIFNEQRHLFDYSEKFHVVCPDINGIERYPWPEDVYRDDDGCNILPVRKFDFVIGQPEEATGNQEIAVLPVHETISHGWPLAIAPVNFEIRLIDNNGELLVPQNVINNTSTPFRVILTSGTKTIEATYNQDTSNPAIYRGTIPELEDEGEYTLAVELVSDHAEFYEPLISIRTRSFLRQDSAWTSSTTYYSILAFLILMLGILIAYQMAIRNNKVNGTLVFRAGNTVIKSFPLGSGKNWKNISSKELAHNPALDLSRLKISSRSKKREGKGSRVEDSDLGMSSVSTTGMNLDHPGVIVSGRTSKDHKKFGFTLEARLGQDYSNNTEAVMEYYPPGEYDGD